VFVVPTDDPDEVAREAAAAAAKAGTSAAAAGPSAAPHHDHSLFAVLQRLNTQCTVYKRSGQELGQGDDEDLGALSIALELSSLYEDISEAVGMWRSTVAAADATADADAAGASAPGTGGTPGRRWGAAAACLPPRLPHCPACLLPRLPACLLHCCLLHCLTGVARSC
jgi:hypothetical protein